MQVVSVMCVRASDRSANAICGTTSSTIETVATRRRPNATRAELDRAAAVRTGSERARDLQVADAEALTAIRGQDHQ